MVAQGTLSQEQTKLFLNSLAFLDTFIVNIIQSLMKEVIGWKTNLTNKLLLTRTPICFGVR